MIIGKGLIASQFLQSDNDETVFFASGVSNSSENDIKQFLREEILLKQTIKNNKNKLLVYFSTCSIYDSSKYDSPYVLHKLHMEEIVKQSINRFLILRISNAVGNGGNSNLLMNYLHKQIVDNKELIIHQNATRNLIDVEDVKKITLKYINSNISNKIVNVAYKDNFYIPEIIETFEKLLRKKAIKLYEDKGEHYSIDIHELKYIFLQNKNEYLKELIKKYYT